MKLYHKVIFPLFCIFILTLIVYSYVLIDPSLTLINHKLWTGIRNAFVQFGYYQRDTSAIVFLFIIASLFLLHRFLVKNYKKVNLIKYLVPLSFLAIFSYPFLSHDFFNYLFDAKIVTFYHQNPYLFKPLDFPQDPWLRFMHWTHRTYPYGPSFILITLIPSFLSFGKFILNFIFFKLTFFIFYLLAVYCLNKMNKKWAIIFATHPLIIIEGLVSSHNDLIGVSFAIIGIFLLVKKKGLLGRLGLLMSGGVKYIALPLVFLTKNHNKINYLVLLSLLIILGYLSFKSEIQPWYFLALFSLLPFYEKIIQNLNIFFAGLLLSYYPYVRYGEWGIAGNVTIKHGIIIIFLTINIFAVIIKLIKFKYNTSKI